MIHIKRILTFLIILSCYHTQVFAEQMIKIRVSEFPPNYYKDANGDWTGLGVELASAIVKKAGFEPVFINEPWARALESMKEGGLQYMTNLKKADGRSAFINWIGPVRNGEVRLIVKKSNEHLPIKSLNDFITISNNKKSKFGYLGNMEYTEEFKKRFASDPEFKESFEPIQSAELNFKKVMAGRIIGFFETTISAEYRIKNDPDYKELATHPFVLRRTPVYHGVSNKGVDKETLDKLRKAFDTLQKDGNIEKIVQKYQ
ncbi:transporter substrate-binding domain-containing protein [Cocleimonas sp. KMM 6892]|uniref:substrate-binding periplasmic protein n=1 Tax=unclassified Cocleimonas TaxID=2639732 RepID=UPI002DBDEC90|nr:MULTISPECIES: transporter substrate-binding domain-containing protein [unclassified Cocleimonas]MEB8431918.1 transporter substrate-binding domain-containing protein [Cocleimonas sp. KMM 6892]MEC4714996.1 transporter substrate-binding domain-containing protein [Cocleimonas sp. KMM 6895]MEC4744190.1 transporter substrate-binding domain-containing protein [Cocleimonas sp. KMM 6896]